MTATVRFDDGWSGRLWLWIDPDGLFEVERDFEKPGDYQGTIEVRADPLEPVSKTFQIRVVAARPHPDVPQAIGENTVKAHRRSLGPSLPGDSP